MKKLHQITLWVFLVIISINMTIMTFNLQENDFNLTEDKYLHIKRLIGNSSIPFIRNSGIISNVMDKTKENLVTLNFVNEIPNPSHNLSIRPKITAEETQVGFTTYHNSFQFLSGTTSIQNIGGTVDPNHAFLMMYYAGTETAKDAAEHQVSGYISSVTEITFERAKADSGAYVSWWVVESPEITVQRGVINLNSGETFNTASISSINISQSIVIGHSRVDDSGASDTYDGFITVELLDSTTVKAERASSADKEPATVRFQVVEWPLEYNIYSGEVVLSTTVSTTTLISGGGSSSDPVLNMSTSWLYFTYDATFNGIQQTSLYGQITNSNEVTFGRYSDSSFINRIRWYIIEHPPKRTMYVQRGEYNWDPPLADTNIRTNVIPSQVVLNRTFIMRSSSTKHTNKDFPQHMNLPRLISPTQWTSTQYRGDTNQDDQHEERWQVILLPPLNYLPTVSNLTFSPDPVHSNETLSLSYDFYDYDGDSEQNTRIRWYKNATFHPEYNDETQIDASSHDEGDTWNVTIRPDDGKDFGNIVWSVTIPVQNTAPHIPSYSISPGSPSTTSTLTLSYSYSDYDDDNETLSKREIQWYKNDALVVSLDDQVVVNASETTKGESWYYKLRVNDGTDYSQWVTSTEVTVVNSAPSVSNILVTPSNPKTGYDLIADYTFTDPDDDSETGSLIHWYRNGIPQWTLNDSLIVNSNLISKGETWYYTIQPSDGTDYGLEKASPFATIENTAPSATNLSITPINPKTGNDLTAIYDWIDPDNATDSESGTLILWYKDGVLQQDLNPNNNTFTINSSDTTKGEEWHFKVCPSDGTEYGVWVSIGNNVTISNTVPLISELILNPSNPTSADELIIDYTYTDVDADAENDTEILWYMNGTLEESLNGSTIVGASYTSKGEEWYCKIRASDGVAFSNWSSILINVTIGNTPPTASNVEIVETSPVPDDSDIHVNYSYSDFDNDLQVNASREIRWYRWNGTDWDPQSILNDMLIIDASNTESGDLWYFTIQVSDGTNLTNPVASPSVSIVVDPNTLPEAKFLNITPANPTTGSELYINWTFYDGDGDNESASMYYWYCDGILISTYNGFQILPSIATAEGEEWHVKVKPRDGKDFGNLTNVPINVTIGNTPPSASDLEITPNNPQTGNYLSISYTFIDVDLEDENGTEIIWYLNGSLQENLNDSRVVEAGYTWKNEVWHFKIRPKDGTDFGLWISCPINVTIGNTAPIVNNLVLSPSNAKTEDDLNATYDYSDPDNDEENGSYIRWFRNSFEVPEFENQTVISTIHTFKGQTWYFIIQPSDGIGYGNERISPAIVITNSVPSAIDLSILPTSPDPTINLFASYNWIDPDNITDSESGTEILWYMDGVLQEELTNNFEVSSSYTSKGQVWHYKIRPSDGSDLGNWTSLQNNITIGNTRPQVSIVRLTPLGTAYTSHTLSAYFEGYDPDGDKFVGYRIIWLNNSVEFPALDNSTEVLPIHTQKDQIWTFQVWMYDGTDWSDPKSPDLGIYIQNSRPYVENVTLNGGQTTIDDIIVEYDFVDTDGDIESNQTVISWKIFRGLELIQDIDTQNNILLSTSIIAGDFIFCLIQPSDSDAYGNNVDSTSFENGFIIVRNSPPEVLGSPTILSGERPNGSLNYYVTAPLYVDYSVIDIDSGENEEIYDVEYINGLVVGSEYRWFRNGELVSELQSPFVDTNLQKGDVWIVSVHPRDRHGDFGAWVNSSAIIIQNSQITVLDIWFENAHTLEIIIGQTYINVDLNVNWTINDADNDTQEGFKTYWFWNNGDGTFVFRADYGTNTTKILSSDLVKDHSWYVVLCVTDDEEWSINKTSEVIKIINMPPSVSNFSFIFESNILQVNPNNRVNEFFIENENITISYEFNDVDNDESSTMIQWFKEFPNGTIVEVYRNTSRGEIYENRSIIPYYETNPGERWYCIITPYDGTDEGTPYQSSSIIIESRPVIQGPPGITPDLSKEGKYLLTVQVTDIRNLISKVEFEMIFEDNSSLYFNSTPQQGNNWTLSFDLMELKDLSYLDSTIRVNVRATTQVYGKNFEIITMYSFNFPITDEVPPRVLDVFYKAENEDNPTNLTFFATVQEFGSEVDQVLLFYTVENETNELTDGFGSSILEIKMVPMSFINTTDDIFLYSAKVNLHPSSAGKITFWIRTVDKHGNIDETAFISEFTLDIPTNNFDLNDVIPLIIIVSFVPIVLLSFAFLIRKKYKKQIRSKIREQIEIGEKKSDIFSLRGIICRNMHGLAFYKKSFIETDQDGDMLAALSTAMSDFVSQISQRTINPGEFDTIKRENFTVLSYYGHYSIISVISEEKLSSFMKKKLHEASKRIESVIPREEIDRGIIFDIEERVKQTLYETLHLGLLHPLTIDYKALEDSKKHLNKDEKKWSDLLHSIPSFIDGKQVFHASTFMSSLNLHRISILKAFNFLEHLYELGLIKKHSENEGEILAIELPGNG